MGPLILALVLAAAPADAGTGTPGPSLAAQHGRAVAEVRCAACHAIDAAGDSPRAGAPTFRQVRIRFNPLSWERAMRAIGAGSHHEMPAVRLDESEVRDLRAYIETLR